MLDRADNIKDNNHISSSMNEIQVWYNTTNVVEKNTQ
jgi:hypothetical protein